MSEDVRAGGAFIELGLNSKKLDEGLRTAKAALQSFSSNLASIGASFGAMGASITTPLIAAAHHFADFGHEIKTMVTTTGMSAEAISAFGPKMESVGHGVREMQRNIASGSDSTRDALASLGLTFADLKGKSPEQQLGLIADRLSTVQDMGQKLAIGGNIFGRRQIAEMLPTLSKGSEGLNQMVERARKMGTTMDSDAVAAADRLWKSFKSLTQSIEGFGLAIGKSVAPLLGPLVDKFAEIVQGARVWVDENEPLVQSIFQVGAGLVVLGAAFATLAAAIYAAMSPAVLIAGGLLLIGSAALAVTDCLGVTSTGFGEMFNSIRIDGTGLGTWMAGLWLFIQKGFNQVVTLSEYAALSWWDSWQYVITKITNAFSYMFEGILRGMASVIDAMKYVSPALNLVNTDKMREAANTMVHYRDIGNAQIEDRNKRRSGVLEKGSEVNSKLEKETQGLFAKDPQKGSGLSFDTSKLRDGMKHLGDNIWGGIMGALDKVSGAMPKRKDAASGAAPAPFGPKDTTQAPGMFQEMKGSAAGTFNVFGVSGMGIGSSAPERTAKACEQIARNTNPDSQSGVQIIGS